MWDEGSRSSATLLSSENRKVSFHSEYSCGTAAIRGSKDLSDGQHFWEIKMTSPVYGTDMVGINEPHNGNGFCMGLHSSKCAVCLFLILNQ